MRKIRFVVLGMLIACRVAMATEAELDEVRVVATGVPTPVAQTGLSVDVIGADSLRAAGVVFMQDALATTAGVALDQNGGDGTKANVFMRGMATRYVGLTIDGINMFDPVANGVIWEDLQVDGLSHIEVVRGSNSVIYGSSAVAGLVAGYSDIGGAFQARSASEQGGFGTSRLSVGVKGSAGQLDYGASTRFMITDGISAADEGDGDDEADGYVAHGSQGRLAYHIGDALTLDLAFRQSAGTGDYDKGAAQDAVGYVRDFDRGAVRFAAQTRLLGMQHELYTTRYGSETEEKPSLVKRDARRIEQGYNGEARTYWGGIAWGLTQTKEHYDVEGGFTAGTFDAVTQSAYALGQFRIARGTYATLATRFDQQSPDKKYLGQQLLDTLPDDEQEGFKQGAREDYKQMLGSRVSLATRVAETIRLRGAYATGFKTPTLFELYDSQSGNRYLIPEESQSTELGLDFIPSKKLELNATLFQIELKNQIYSKQTSLISFVDPEGTIFYKYVNSQRAGIAQANGGEVRVGWRIGARGSLSANYSYTDNKKPDGKRDIRRPRHMVNLALDYRIGDALAMHLSARRVQDVTDTDFSKTGYPTVILKDYSLLNLGVRYGLGSTPNGGFQLYGRVDNALDEDYTTAFGYGTLGRAVYIGFRTRFD